ncbi:MAG: transposase [Candidatus Omnitrophica bacterium]|nr:transposase [Candidatus Omnitrophota bacterium]MDD5353369.1 transposase [Candidatus Omnitrophota bacterium]MDD5592071.1 transposase [Candidatus Omnitrophota bacterium]
MPRYKRITLINAAMHVICRGNNRNNVFHSDNDKLRYYALLEEIKDENRIDILHYCLMDNHLHIILRLNLESKVSRFMKQVNLTYFHYYRKRYGYFGHFWQDRFKSNIIELDSYLLQCGKYIELNPVRVGIVSHPGDYPFSSYNFYAKGKPDTLITPSPAYLGLSDSATSRQKQYVDFVVDNSIINPGMLEKRLYIGSQAFINKLQAYYNIKNRREDRGRPPKGK